jgi:hypothetical protein
MEAIAMGRPLVARSGNPRFCPDSRYDATGT